MYKFVQLIEHFIEIQGSLIIHKNFKIVATISSALLNPLKN